MALGTSRQAVNTGDDPETEWASLRLPDDLMMCMCVHRVCAVCPSQLKQAHGAANPFDAGICHNCNESCCVVRRQGSNSHVQTLVSP